jgi:hypothetical protein
MSINTEPTMPGYLWSQRPLPVDPWAPARAPQPWAASPQPAHQSTPSAMAPTPMAPGWAPPMPPLNAGQRRRWLPVATAASAVALAAAGLVAALVVTHQSDSAAADRPVTASAPSTPVAPPPPALVRDESLPALLLDTATVNAVMVTTDMAVYPKLSSAKLFIDTTDKPECGGVWANANEGAYTGSGWQAVQTQALREHDHPQHEIYQSVVSFPSADAAKDFVAKEGQRWPQCTNTSLTTTNPNMAAQTWLITGVSQDGDVLTSVSKREGSSGYTCQHALTARNNVVIDAEACGWDVAHQGSTIAARIAEQITRTL